MEHATPNPDSQSRFAQGAAPGAPVIGNPVWRWLTQRVGINTAIAAFCLLLIAAVWTVVVIETNSKRAETIANAIRQNSNLAKAFEENTIRTIKGVDAAARFIAYEYARLGTKVDLARYLKDGFIDGKLFNIVSVVNESGDIVLSSIVTGPVNYADREHFKFHLLHKSDELFISKPVFGRISRVWQIPMTRRINKRDGAFGGVVVLSVDPAYFANFYRQADLGENGIVNLIGLDGISRARRSGGTVSSGQNLSSSAIFEALSSRASGSILGPGTSEKVPRYISYRTLPEYPLAVAVGTSQEEVLARFMQDRNHDYWAALLFTAVILSFAGLLMAALARQKRTVAALLGSDVRFRATFNQAAIGISQTALDGRILQANQKVCDILGYSRQELLTMSFREITHPDDVATSAARRKRLLAGETIDTGLEKRYLRKDGTVVWIAISTALVRDARGEPDYFINMIEAITERRQMQQTLLHLAHHDSLTGLPNRDLFYDRLEHAIEQARRRHWNTGVMFIDLDRFKAVNDTLGHGAGDQLLRQVAARLAQCVRADDTVGRLGGDEFAVILSELAHDEDGSLVARKIIDALAKPFQIDGNELFVTASIDITACPRDSAYADTLVRNADSAMYDAKKMGKNNYQFYTAATNQRVKEKLALEGDLRQALMRNEFVLHFQPKAHLVTGRITGMEALLRWQHPAGAIVPPAEFIPLLEETGLIVPAGEWVVRTACAQISAWQAAGLTPVPVAVNLSARQFHQQDICELVTRALREYAVDPQLLELEITESAAMLDAEHTATTLHALKALGVRIAIDDFGTGYSSLSYLKRFPIDSLKIDRSFVTELPGNEDDASIAQAVITMAHALRLNVIAEGVENEAQLEFLAANGCDEMQGYLFSRPLPVADCTQLLREQRMLPLYQTRAGKRKQFTVVATT